MSSNANRELAFCHRCENEWFRDEHGLICPECHSDFVEVIENNSDPRATESPSAAEILSDHRPWGSAAPDPDEEDISQFDAPSRMANNTRGQGLRVPRGSQPPPGVFNPFTSLLGPMGGPSPFGDLFSGDQPRRRRDSDHSRSRSVPDSRLTSGPSSSEPHVRIYRNVGPNGSITMQTSTFSYGPNRGSTGREMQMQDFSQMFNQLIQSIGARPGQAGHGGGDPFANLMQSVLGPMGQIPPGFSAGDFVSEAGIHNLATRLMDENAMANQPTGASESAINALKETPATQHHLGDTGDTNCPICIDQVKLGDMITELPCKHWFHLDCIKNWLAQHDTCAICRAGIEPKDGEAGSLRRSDQEPRHNEDPVVVARRQSNNMHGEGTADNPIWVPESPSNARRQPGREPRPYNRVRRHSSGLDTRVNDEPPSPSAGRSRRTSRDSGPGTIDRVRNWFSGSSGSKR